MLYNLRCFLCSFIHFMRYFRIFVFNKSAVFPNSSSCLFFIKIKNNHNKVMYLHDLTRKCGMGEPTEIYKENDMILSC